jgi:hypothetical protein
LGVANRAKLIKIGALQSGRLRSHIDRGLDHQEGDDQKDRGQRLRQRSVQTKIRKQITLHFVSSDCVDLML